VRLDERPAGAAHSAGKCCCFRSRHGICLGPLQPLLRALAHRILNNLVHSIRVREAEEGTSLEADEGTSLISLFSQRAWWIPEIRVTMETGICPRGFPQVLTVTVSSSSQGHLPSRVFVADVPFEAQSPPAHHVRSGPLLVGAIARLLLGST
jgi:hypothetical protein